MRPPLGARLPPPPALPQRRVVVTGAGLVTPLGVGVEHTWRRLVAGDVAVGALSGPRFDALPSRVAGVVPRGKAPGQFDVDAHVPRALKSAGSVEFVAFALAAAAEALAAAGLPLGGGDGGGGAPQQPHAYARERVGVALGSGIGGIADTVAAAEAMAADPAGGHRRVSPFFVPRILANMAAGHVGIAWGLKGPQHAASTACATGAHAIGDAFRFIKHGHADAMVAGGSEACVHPIALAGFSRAKALSTRHNDDPARASRPFDATRDGFVLGEGAGVVVLEERSSALARGAPILAEVRGYGAAGDAHHITSPAEDGNGALRCMRAALAEGGLQPHHVGYVNAHATSTPLGDAIEARAIDALLGGGAGEGRLAPPLVSSTKGAVGHLLGAAGAVEAVFALLALQRVRLPWVAGGRRGGGGAKMVGRLPRYDPGAHKGAMESLARLTCPHPLSSPSPLHHPRTAGHRAPQCQPDDPRLHARPLCVRHAAGHAHARRRARGPHQQLWVRGHLLRPRVCAR